MRRGRIFFFLAFILVLGLAAVVLVWQKFLQPSPVASAPAGVEAPAAAPAVTTVNVVMVTQRVGRGEIIRPEVLQAVPFPQDLVIQGMYTNMEEAVGRQAKFDLESGVPLTSGMVVDNAESLSATGSNAALQIPRGMVAVSVPISRLSSVSFAPKAGDHVNVIVSMLLADIDSDFQTVLPNRTMGVIAPGTGKVTGQAAGASGTAGLEFESNAITAVGGGGIATQGRAEIDPTLGQTFYVVPSEAQRPRMVSQSLLQDVVVLHMGNFPTTDEEVPAAQVAADEQTVPVENQSNQGTETEEAPPIQTPDVVTLVVSPQDAVTLNYMMFSGAQLTLALRGSGDDSRVHTEAVTLQFLLDQYSIPVPVKLPYGINPRVDEIVAPVLSNDALATPVP